MALDNAASEHEHDTPTLSIRGLGRVRVRPSKHRTLALAYRLPLRVNYYEFANSYLTASVEPQLPRGDVIALPERDRRRLLLAIVRRRGVEVAWQHLYGTHLSLDERFFAVMRSADERDRRERLERLRQMRAKNAAQLNATIRAASANVRKLTMPSLRDQLAPRVGFSTRIPTVPMLKPPVTLVKPPVSFMQPPAAVMKPALSVLTLPNVALTPPLRERLVVRPPAVNQVAAQLARTHRTWPGSPGSLSKSELSLGAPGSCGPWRTRARTCWPQPA